MGMGRIERERSLNSPLLSNGMYLNNLQGCEWWELQELPCFKDYGLMKIKKK